jgi:hypothetical protein
MIPDISTKDIEVKLLSEYTELPEGLPRVSPADNKRCTYKQIQAEFRCEGKRC